MCLIVEFYFILKFMIIFCHCSQWKMEFFFFNCEGHDICEYYNSNNTFTLGSIFNF